MSLGRYWQRTLKEFVGHRVKVTTKGDKELVGELVTLGDNVGLEVRTSPVGRHAGVEVDMVRYETLVSVELLP